MRKLINRKRVCKNCSKQFLASSSNILRGFGIYCGKKCFYETQMGRIPWNKDKKGLVKGWNKGKTMGIELRKLHRQASWRKYNNKPEVRERSYLMRIKRKNAVTTPFNNKYWEYICKVLNYRCQLCFKQLPFEKLTADHILPISKGGDNQEWNIQPLCKSCNSRKSNKFIIGFENILPELAYGDWVRLHRRIPI